MRDYIRLRRNQQYGVRLTVDWIHGETAHCWHKPPRCVQCWGVMHTSYEVLPNKENNECEDWNPGACGSVWLQLGYGWQKKPSLHRTKNNMKTCTQVECSFAIIFIYYLFAVVFHFLQFANSCIFIHQIILNM